MKKVLTIIMALAIAMSLAVPAFAYDGSTAATTKSWTSWWDHWKNPTPSEPTTPSEPEAEIGVPSITEARFYHSGYVASLKNRLQISWNAVDEADSYEIEVLKADGSTATYTSSSTTLMVKNSTCPKVYVEDTSTWTSATVRVRAISGDTLGDWSEVVKIGCDKIH